MDVYTAINERRSIRKYTNEQVPEEKLNNVLKAAQAAPSWANKQCWRFVVVKDEAKKEDLASAIPDKNPAKKSLAQAPVVIVQLADPEESGKAESKEYYLLDAGISMQQLMLAAHAEGLGTCWIAWMEDEEKIRKTCNVPDNLKIVALTPLGYPEKESKPTPRKELSEIVCYEEWGS